MAELENVTVHTDSDTHRNVDVQFSLRWLRIHISEQTELWVPRERIVRIEVNK